MGELDPDMQEEHEPRWVSFFDNWESNIPLFVFGLLFLFIIASSISAIYGAAKQNDAPFWQSFVTIIPFVVFILLTLAFSTWFIACFTGEPNDDKRKQSFRFAYAFTITSFVVLMLPVANPWQPEILGPISLIRGCVVPESPTDNSVPRAVSCVRGEQSYFPAAQASASAPDRRGNIQTPAEPAGPPTIKQVREANDGAAYPWLVTIGGFNGVVVDTYPPGGRARYNVVKGGFVVPFYVVLLALVGGAVSLTRRIPEYQKRSEDNFVPDGAVTALSQLETREVVVFQIMQLISAGFIAVVAFYALSPNSMSTAIALSFMSGFSSELILLQIRSIVEGLQPKAAKPTFGGKPDNKIGAGDKAIDGNSEPR
ncbi:hypothetical protein BG58_40940 [Caballeronia jiangsuensis]|nr:hypothetical protein BG58_40940 [Caballeronia jiangsuensis]